MKKRLVKATLASLLAFSMLLTGCGQASPAQTEETTAAESIAAESVVAETQQETAAAEETEQDVSTETADAAEETAIEKNGEIYILCTSDVHCGIDQGFGYAGLQQVRDTLEAQGYETLLIDDGDAIQGEAIGTLSKGESIIELMNDLQYDIAIPGNHEFDYGMDTFLSLVEKAEFPYISCNFCYKDEPVLDPYVIEEVAGHKIGFVGVTTPKTLTSSTPAYFQNEDGDYVYGFLQDKTGEAVYNAVQNAIDSAKAEGAELIYVIGHLGNEAECAPWTYVDLIENTSGINVLLDGHSHDTDHVVMKDKDGNEVTRIGVGTKMSCIGYSHISAEGEITETDVWTWNNDESAPALLNIQNEISAKVDASAKELEELLGQVVASTDVDLIIADPEAKDENGKPIRIVRSQETNLGDLCADAYRDQSGADIAFVNGGGIRTSIEKGDITYGDIISVHPFGNMLCVIEVSGQQILDALEWGSRSVPGETGGFLQVSGLSYEIRSDIDSPCQMDENSLFTGIRGERRVQNVKVGEEDLDPGKTYTLASHDYMLLGNGDGYTMFDGAVLLQDKVKLDNQVLIDYIVDTLGGVVGSDYADPYGQGRITVLE
ncbi:MAG: bifunctional metallophosphatase/5'-nucleotidase [Lachnospiraceae bacterium]|nr:bifunctional metallophosphatase/5'-nucleotidase [Lachnospiraceae bacterium]